MFPPQRKKGDWSGWSKPQKSGAVQDNGSAQRTNPRSLVPGRGKGVVGAEEGSLPPPPQELLAENIAEAVGGSGRGGSEDWRKFRESGLLDEKGLLRKDNEALLKRVSILERERDECLYNMGVLLMEKEGWSSQIEELRQALNESQEISKREQTAHIISVSEFEKHEENLKKAFGVEKQCVLDLEKALHEMRAEVAETKFASEKKLTDAHALEASLEEKQLEIEAKQHSASAGLAEANRKSSEMNRKLEELEAREHKLQIEHSFLNTEREALERDVLKQREHLRVWEKELQEKQRRLLDEQKLLNDREEKANDIDIVLKKNEVEIEEARKKIDAASSSLKSQNDDLSARLRALTVKEKDAEIKSAVLDKREKELMTTEEKLNIREREEIQKLLDDHNAILDAKKQDFEIEILGKKRSFEEERKNHLEMLEKDKSEVRCKLQQLTGREIALKAEIDYFKCEQKDLDIKSNAMKNWEDSLQADEKRLQEERKHLSKATSELEISRTKLLDDKAVVETEGQKIILEKEKLKLMQVEREQHFKLQSELKLEKDEYLRMLKSLEKEKEALRQERDTFERDWEVLDGKRVSLEAELKQLTVEKEGIQKWQHKEEDRLKNEGLRAMANIQRELEDLRLKKEAFEKMIEQERAELHSEVDKERYDMSQEFDLLKHELEMKMQRKQDDLEKEFQEKENEFERWRVAELGCIKSSSESNDLNFRRLEMEQSQLQKEKAEFSEKRRNLEVEQEEIQKDIEALLRLSKNLKYQREEFAKEKEMFLSAVDKCKTCHNCGVSVITFDLLDIGPLGVTEDSEELLPSIADDILEEHLNDGSIAVSHEGPVVRSTKSGSPMTRWFKKCASLFKVSPTTDICPPENQGRTSFGEQLNSAVLEDADYERVPSTTHSVEQKMVHFDGGEEVTGDLNRIDKADEAEASFALTDNSKEFLQFQSNDGTQKVADDENNEMEGSSMQVENDSQPDPSRMVLRRHTSRKAKLKPIKRTRSVKAVVEDAKSILGESSELKRDEQQNGDAIDSQSIPVESQGASVQADQQADQAASNTRQKRQPTELEPEGSEAPSESVSLRGRIKRRRTSSQAPVPVDKQYNLRSSNVESKEVVSQL